MNSIPITLQKKIIGFLTSLPNIHDSNGQKALIAIAGLDSQFDSLIAFGESPTHFFPLLVSNTLAYGRLSDGRHPLEAILEASKNSIGQDKQKQCESLIQELKTFTKSIEKESAIIMFEESKGNHAAETIQNPSSADHIVTKPEKPISPITSENSKRIVHSSSQDRIKKMPWYLLAIIGIVSIIISLVIWQILYPQKEEVHHIKGVVYVDKKLQAEVKILLLEAEIFRITNNFGVFEMLLPKNDFQKEYTFVVFYKDIEKHFIIKHGELDNIKFSLEKPVQQASLSNEKQNPVTTPINETLTQSKQNLEIEATPTHQPEATPTSNPVPSPTQTILLYRESQLSDIRNNTIAINEETKEQDNNTVTGDLEKGMVNIFILVLVSAIIIAGLLGGAEAFINHFSYHTRSFVRIVTTLVCIMIFFFFLFLLLAILFPDLFIVRWIQNQFP